MNANLPDLYGPFYRAAQQARVWQRWAMALGLVVVFQALVLAVVVLQPPWVIVKDRLDSKPALLSRMASDPAISLADARLFFGHMVGLRYGWQSSSVLRDLEKFLLQCHPAHRQVQLRHLKGSVQHGAAGAGAGAPSAAAKAEGSDRAVARLTAWQQANIVNHLALPANSEEVHCRVRDKEPVWDCAMQASIVAQAQLGQRAVEAEAFHTTSQRGTFVATFVEVPHTAKTPHGLLVAHLDWLEGNQDALAGTGVEP